MFECMFVVVSASYKKTLLYVTGSSLCVRLLNVDVSKRISYTIKKWRHWWWHNVYTRYILLSLHLSSYHLLYTVCVCPFCPCYTWAWLCSLSLNKNTDFWNRIREIQLIWSCG